MLVNAATICCLRAFPISLSRGKFNACVNGTRINNNPKQHRSKENSEKQKKIKINQPKLAISSFNQPDTRLVFSHVQLDTARNRQSHEICFKEIPRWWSIIRNTRTVHNVDTIVGQKVTILPAARQQGSLKEHAYIYTRVQVCAMCAQVCARWSYVCVRIDARGERGARLWETI